MRRCFSPLALLPLLAFPYALHAAVTLDQQPTTLTLTGAGPNLLQIEVIADDILRVAYAPNRAFFSHPSFATGIKTITPSTWSVTTDAHAITLTTAKLKAIVDATTGTVRFEDLAGHSLLAEAPAGRSLNPDHSLRQQWLPQPDESLYGLGQHQYGLLNLQGQDLDLWQHNTEIAVPFLVSSKGYGLFWDNPSYTKFGDPRPYAPIPPDHLFDASGTPGGFTTTPFTDAAMLHPGTPRLEPAIQNADPENPSLYTPNPQEPALTWQAQLQADTTGDYHFQLYANGGYKMWIDGQLVIDHWRQSWLPWADLAKAHFDAHSTHDLKVQWIKDGCTYCSLTWKPPLPNTPDPATISLWSQVGDGIDYTFVYGPSLDHVIAGYRQLTGNVPMMPAWAFGLWQSRQRYKTQQESLDIVNGFRSRHIPFDNIVQDWLYWREDDWGSHRFDPERFPTPDQWVKDLHAQHAHVMISVWGKFYTSTDNFKTMHDAGYLFPVDPAIKDWVGPGYAYTFYDAFNPGARKMFWSSVHDRLFSKGIDAWWMDATEPDLLPSPPTLARQLADMPTTAAGPGAAVLNAYPLLNSQGVYEGQRQAAPDQRVFILTRSGYAGSQHYAAANWSGDISSTWTAMKKQIAAALGYSISGLPYWTMDSGGFAVPARFSNHPTAAATEEWRELNTRWFEFSAFVPLLRVHGEFPFREMWQFGGDHSEAYNAQLKFDRLRYRLFPYIYSLAGNVTQNNGTIMRPLVMDFPNDPTARNLTDQYLFGPSLLVSPVTTYLARSRPVYLPEGTWYDFWTGTALDGHRTIDAPAPYDAIPLHVRAGSILPVGPDQQYIHEKAADPITLYIYTGKDAHLTLYEDDGTTYQYEKGAFSEIPIDWNDATHTLTLGTRSGNYPGMLQQRNFHILFISKENPVPFGIETTAQTIHYTGSEISIPHP
jgi:alpha-D-xyloside xylohydrolase